MQPPSQRFNRLLCELEAARLTDEALHRTNASLSERTASHDTLSRLRAEIAKARIAYDGDTIDSHGVNRTSVDS